MLPLLVLAACSPQHPESQKMTESSVTLGDTPDWRDKATIVRPEVINDVLVNPGIGFMTFQRFNGDKLNEGTGWTEGHPIEYQPFNGNLKTPNHPMTSLAYFRVYWKYLEPEEGKYQWDLIDKAMKTASERGQTLLLRIAPYSNARNEKDCDIPDWYRRRIGPEADLEHGWRTNPEDPRYPEYFGRMIRALGKRYNANPLLESVDVSIVGPWGEGAGSDKLTQKTREALVDAYADAFPNTHLIMLLTDAATNTYGLTRKNMGWRIDCLGDVGGFNKTWNHMFDYYPKAIIEFGMQDAWKKAPVTLEVCWVMQHWKNKGWDVDYMIDQSLKWHISSFNAKSSAVPEEWKPHVDRWLKHMGYRLALRKLSYQPKVQPGGKLPFNTWWENLGVAPPYQKFRFAFRLKSNAYETILPTDADLTTFLPGDNLHNAHVNLPNDIPPGDYDLQIAILDPRQNSPKVRLAIANRQPDGWYPMNKITVEPKQPANQNP
jgi:hypothetical protein